MSKSIFRRLFRTALVGGLLAGGALVAGTSGAQAADGTIAGCGADWLLVTPADAAQFIWNSTPSVQPYRDQAWKTTTTNNIAAYDASAKGGGDGYVCVKRTGSTPGSDKQYCARYGYPVCFNYDVVNINDNKSPGRGISV